MSFAYDGAGNLTTRTPASGAAQTLTWDVEGELASVNAGADDASSFVYDADGSRVVRQDATGTTAYLPGGQEIHVDSSGDVSATRYYSFGGQTVAVRTDRGLGGVVSLVSDHHGTVVAGVPNTTWTTTSVSKQYTDPFGAVRGGSGDVPGDRQFLGATRDDTGLTLLGARYYDENAGRFVSVDPILDASDPQQWQGYAYANNNPVTFSDPTGAIYEGGNSSLTASSYKYTGNGRGVAGTSVKATPAKVASKVAPSSTRRSWSGTYVGGAGGASTSAAASVAAPAGVSDYLFAQGGGHSSSGGEVTWGGLIGGAAGVIAGAVCAAVAVPTTGPGAIGCAAVGGAVAGAVSNLWDTRVAHTQEFSAEALVRDVALGGALSALTAGVGVGAVGTTASLRGSLQMAAARPTFIASSNGVVLPTSASRLAAGFERAGFQAAPTVSAGVSYTLPDGSLARVMQPAGKAPLRASFTNARGGPISPFTGKPVQPPPGLSKSERVEYVRERTHVRLEP
jgi:RHS repeat-associated protein